MGLLDRLRSTIRGAIAGQRPPDDPTTDAGPIDDPSITTKRAELVGLLEANGGRMKQANLVSVTDWSAATVSRELGEMEADGLVHKISIGRSNLVALVGAEPDWYTPPDATGESDAITATADGSAILLIEDDEDDATLFKRAFEEAGVTNPIHTVRDGYDAVEFLRKQGSYADAPTPALVLLDLQLMVIDGFEVLRELDDGDSIRPYPVVVLSHSADPEDVRESYRAGATAYLSKPTDLEGIVDLVAAIDGFWLSESLQLPEAEQNRSGGKRLVSYSE